MLTNDDMDCRSPFACLLLGQPTLRQRVKQGTMAALDQRIGLLERLDENIGALEVELTSDDLREIEDASSKITLPGPGIPNTSSD